MAKTTRDGSNGGTRIEDEMMAHFGFVPEFYRSLPRAAEPAAWGLHRDFELAETAIPRRYKELIGLAVAAHIKCRYCVYFHTEAARANGASDDELREAVLMGGTTVLFSNALTGMQVDLSHFQEEVDRAVEHMSAQLSAGASPSP